MKKLNQKGALDMMFVVLLVVLLAFGGFVVWRVTAADNETADSAVSTQAGSESVTSAGGSDSGQPEGVSRQETGNETEDESMIVFEDSDLNIAFEYPASWGKLTTTLQDPEDRRDKHDGKLVHLEFSNSTIKGSAISADYAFKGLGYGLGFWQIFEPNFQEAISSNAQYAKDNPDEVVLEQNTSKSLVYGSSNCISGGIVVTGTYKLTSGDYAVMRLAYEASPEPNEIFCGDIDAQVIRANVDAQVFNDFASVSEL